MAVRHDSVYQRWGKRVFDIIGSSIGLILLLPVILLIMASAAICNRGKVLFTQTRPGKFGKPFRIVKLKTMRDAYDERGKLLPDEMRLTLFGRIVRKLSFDELFQLFNVLKGDMSFIGPRPLLMQYLPLYSSFEMQRHDVMPGISGLAQIKGRNELSWRRRFRYDVFYARHVSLGFDLALCWLTIKKIIKADDINAKGKTVEELTFKGTSFEKAR